MTRLIDADALHITVIGGRMNGKVEFAKAIEETIKKAPTIDAEPVIRCCDCIHFEYFEDQFTQMTHCDVHDRCPDYTDYCSWAERKEE